MRLFSIKTDSERVSGVLRVTQPPPGGESGFKSQQLRKARWCPYPSPQPRYTGQKFPKLGMSCSLLWS